MSEIFLNLAPYALLALLLIGLVAGLGGLAWQRRSSRLREAGLNARYSELASWSESAHEKMTADTEVIERLQGKLDRYRKANVELKRALEQAEGLLHMGTEEMELVRRDLFVQRRHTVFLDGMPGAGKTTFLERLTNPMATPDQLLQQVSTALPYHTDPIPLCWETVDGVRILHTLEFFDIGGEQPQHVIDNILLYRERKLASHGRALALVLWDTAAGHPTNVGYLNTGRMSAVYGPRIARETILALVFFFNKCDILEGRGGHAELDDVIDLQQRILLTEVFEKSLNGYPVPLFTHGSALTGSGVHFCLGRIIHALELGHLFERPGASKEASPG